MSVGCEPSSPLVSRSIPSFFPKVATFWLYVQLLTDTISITNTPLPCSGRKVAIIHNELSSMIKWNSPQLDVYSGEDGMRWGGNLKLGRGKGRYPSSIQKAEETIGRQSIRATGAC